MVVSSCLWDVQDSLILCRVSEVNPHFVLRTFHVPLVMVHPWVGWARVVNPSCVMTVESCMFSSHRRDFCWIWTHPSPLSDVGRASFSESSRNVILMFESVTRGGWLAMSGGGSWYHITAGGEGSVGATRFPLHTSVTIHFPSLWLLVSAEEVVSLWMRDLLPNHQCTWRWLDVGIVLCVSPFVRLCCS